MPLSTLAVAKLVQFAESRGFDLACYPGITPDIPNRFNRWREADLYRACLALLGSEHDAFARSYPFDISSPRDVRPYLGHSFRFSLLPLLWGRQVGADRILLESGYLIQLGTTLLAAFGGGLLLLMPVLAPRQSAQGVLAVGGYFALIGMGFMSYEIYMIEKLSLWLGQPLLAFALAVALILLAAGLGSALSAALARHFGSVPKLLTRALALIVCLLFGTLLLTSQYQTVILGAPFVIRLLIGAVLIVPLAFCLGLFLPLGLTVLSELRPRLLPWAWACNGAASVLAAALAVLLALDFGQDALLALAAVCYCLAMISARRWQPYP